MTLFVWFATGSLSSESTEAAGLQDRQTRFGAAVDLVMVNVAVVGPDGLPMTGLTREDFVVAEDGVQREPAVLLAPDDTPLDVALVVDLSGSMERQAWRQWALEVLDSLGPADCVYLGAFSTTVGASRWGRPSDPAMRNLVEAWNVEGHTSLYDALVVALSELGGVDIAGAYELLYANGQAAASAPQLTPPESACPEPMRSDLNDPGKHRRKALVAVTDGEDTSSYHSVGHVLRTAMLSEVPIFQVYSARRPRAFVMPPSVGTIPGQRSAAAGARAGGPVGSARAEGESFDEIAAMTGGQALRGSQSHNELIASLRTRYVVGYYIAAPTETPRAELTIHELEVDVQRPGARTIHPSVLYRPTRDVELARLELEAGRKALRAELVPDAAAAFDRSIRADSDFAPAHYYRATVLAMQGRVQEAVDSAMEAAALDPGAGEVHRLVAELAIQRNDYNTASDHAVRAAHAGADMAGFWDKLPGSLIPADELEKRLGVPLALVMATPAADLDPVSLAALESKVVVGLRRAVSESQLVGLATDPRRAGHVILVEGRELSQGDVRRYVIRVELVDADGRRLLRRDVNLEDIDDRGRIATDLADLVSEIEARLRER